MARCSQGEVCSHSGTAEFVRTLGTVLSLEVSPCDGWSDDPPPPAPVFVWEASGHCPAERGGRAPPSRTALHPHQLRAARCLPAASPPSQLSPGCSFACRSTKQPLRTARVRAVRPRSGPLQGSASFLAPELGTVLTELRRGEGGQSKAERQAPRSCGWCPPADSRHTRSPATSSLGDEVGSGRRGSHPEAKPTQKGLSPQCIVYPRD